MKKHFYKKMMILLFVFLVSFIIALRFGAANTSFQDVFFAFFSPYKTQQSIVLFEIRFPRIIAGIMVGLALGLAGSLMQGVTRNPLADPGLLGVSAGAVLFITLGQIIFSQMSYLGMIMFSFLGSVIGISMVLSLSYFSKRKMTTITLVLAGSAISTMMFALAQGMGLVFNVSKDVSLWTSGGLTNLTYQHIVLALPIIIIGVILSRILAKDVTALSLNEDVAIGLGLSIHKTKMLIYFVIALLTGISVALAGSLTFVGMMIPHISRMIVGYDYKRIIPASIMIGAIFILLSDTIARVINAPYETPLIAIVSVVGLPFFLFVIKQKTGGQL